MNRLLDYAPRSRHRWWWPARYCVAFLVYYTVSNGSHSLLAETRNTPLYEPTRLLFTVSAFPAALLYDRASHLKGPSMSGPTPPGIVLNPWFYAFLFLSICQMLVVPLLILIAFERLRSRQKG